MARSCCFARTRIRAEGNEGDGGPVHAGRHLRVASGLLQGASFEGRPGREPLERTPLGQIKNRSGFNPTTYPAWIPNTAIVGALRARGRVSAGSVGASNIALSGLIRICATTRPNRRCWSPGDSWSVRCMADFKTGETMHSDNQSAPMLMAQPSAASACDGRAEA